MTDQINILFAAVLEYHCVIVFYLTFSIKITMETFLLSLYPVG